MKLDEVKKLLEANGSEIGLLWIDWVGDESTPKEWWGYFVGILAVYALGIYVQYKHTGRQRGGDHQGTQAKPVANPILQ